MASIGRRIEKSVCKGVVLTDSCEFEAVEFILYGDYTPERATRKLRRDYRDNTITINEVVHQSAYHKMPIEKFELESERID